jgi:hypothetical protein
MWYTDIRKELVRTWRWGAPQTGFLYVRLCFEVPGFNGQGGLGLAMPILHM